MPGAKRYLPLRLRHRLPALRHKISSVYEIVLTVRERKLVQQRHVRSGAARAGLDAVGGTAADGASVRAARRSDWGVSTAEADGAGRRNLLPVQRIAEG